MPAPQLIFLGDSLIEFHDWQYSFPGYAVTNLGLAGETVQELAGRLDRLFARPKHPDWLLVMIGTNNVAMEDYGFFAEYRAVVSSLRQRYPAAALQITSLLPMRLPWLAPDTIPRLNDRLRTLAQELGASYLDLYGAFQRNASAAPLFLADGVHLSEEGYALWVRTIAPLLPPLAP